MTIWLVIHGSSYEGNYYESVASAWSTEEKAKREIERLGSVAMKGHVYRVESIHVE